MRTTLKSTRPRGRQSGGHVIRRFQGTGKSPGFLKNTICNGFIFEDLMRISFQLKMEVVFPPNRKPGF